MNKIQRFILAEIRKQLNESFINVFSDEDKYKYIDDVWDILQRTYKPIGGFKTASSKQELIDKSWLWKLVRKNKNLVAVAIYIDNQGRKTIAVGSDGTPIGKKQVIQMFIDDIKQTGRNTWSEVSGASEHIALKFGSVPIPNKLAKAILKKEIISYNSDGFHYTRLIGGEPHEKILVGNIKK